LLRYVETDNLGASTCQLTPDSTVATRKVKYPGTAQGAYQVELGCGDRISVLVAPTGFVEISDLIIPSYRHTSNVTYRLAPQQ
jgi:hypothetical protein